MNRVLGSLIVLFAAAGSGFAADPPTTAELVVELSRQSAAATKLIDGVKDKAGAEKAKAAVDAAVSGFEKAMAELEKRPEDEVRKVFEARKDANLSDFFTAYERLLTRSPEAAAVLAETPALKRFVARADSGREGRATMAARTLGVAAKAYRVKFMAWPEKLADLTNPPGGGPPYIKGGENPLLDPWGKEFKYQVAKDEKGEEQPYIWTERAVGGKTKVYGTKPPEKK